MIIYAGGEITPIQIGQSHFEGVTEYRTGIFLAGPTSRTPNNPGWRPEAIKIFTELNFDGPVYIPEPSPGDTWLRYEEQVAWEWEGLDRAKTVLFWVPRDMVLMPALTTNVEFGRYLDSGKIVFGAPDNAAHNRYLEHACKIKGIPVRRTLLATIHSAITAHQK